MEGQGVTFTVSCALEECAERICRAVVDGSVTGECIDRYRAGGPTDAAAWRWSLKSTITGRETA